MFPTLSQAAAAVKATRSSAPHDTQRRHQAAWSGGAHLPPGGGEAAGRGKEWCLRSGPLLLGDLPVVWAGFRAADPDLVSAAPLSFGSGGNVSWAPKEGKVRRRVTFCLSEWVNYGSLLFACVLRRCSCEIVETFVVNAGAGEDGSIPQVTQHFIKIHNLLGIFLDFGCLFLCVLMFLIYFLVQLNF